MSYQQTVGSIQYISGVGLHSGETINLSIAPIKENSGIVFKRSDLRTNNIIEAKFSNVSSTTLCTEISNSSGVKVATIEHIMAALWGMNIDNALIEVSGPEVPAMDGSSKEFIELIKRSGIQKQSNKRRYIKILDTVAISDGDKEITIESSDKFQIDFDIDFAHKSIGHQNYILSDSSKFVKEVGDARTFGFYKEVEHLQKRGLAKGASLNNTIGIDDNGVMNPNGLRYKDEFVKHKTLDCIGDLFLAGHRIVGNVKANKGGHKINNEILKKLFNNTNCFKMI